MKRLSFLSLCVLVALFIGIFSTSCTKEYTVTVIAGEGGVASADKTSAMEGETVTLTATANEGYIFKQWSIESGSIVLSPNEEANPVTFVMSADIVSIKAEFSTLGGQFGIETVKIQAGTFLMGSPENEPNRSSYETQHEVTLTKDFYMSKYQITNSQYADFLNDMGVSGVSVSYLGEDFIGAICTWGERSGRYLVYDPSNSSKYSSYNWSLNWDSANSKWKPVAGYENHPVIWVTWHGAIEYAIWIGGSLPTEAQWEYACRAGTTTVYSYGDAVDSDYMWYLDNSSGVSKAVGLKKANLWGLYDMHGNVREWCSDWWSGEYGTDPVTDPKGPIAGNMRILRGGSWFYHEQYCRSASRDSNELNYASNTIGFRVAFVP